MSTKKPPPTDDEDYEGDFDYVQDDDDDDEDDDEGDFVPGAEEEEEDEEEIVPLFDGTLSIDQEKLLHYRGEGIHLTSIEEVSPSLLTAEPPTNHQTMSIQMEGPCDVETNGSGNPTHRKMEVTWSVQKTANNGGNAQLPLARAKRGDDDDDEGGGGGKMPSLCYRVYGRQMDTAKGEILEFKGSYSPTGSKEASLVCQVRIVQSKPPVATGASASAAKPVAAAAARVANDDDDDGDDDDDADDGVDYEELIALHADAGLPVEALRKRYRGEKGDDSTPSKKGKPMPKSDDDDDDYGF